MKDSGKTVRLRDIHLRRISDPETDILLIVSLSVAIRVERHW